MSESQIIRDMRNNIIMLLVIAIIGSVSFALLPWTTTIYHSAGDAINEENGDAPSGLDVLQNSDDYPFADSPWVLAVAIGLGITVLSLIAGIVMLKYELMLQQVRFVTAAVVVLGCVIAGIKIAQTEIGSNSFIARFQFGADQTAICTSAADGSGTYCMPGDDATRHKPNYGLIIVAVAGGLIALSSRFPTPVGIQSAWKAIRAPQETPEGDGLTE